MKFRSIALFILISSFQSNVQCTSANSDDILYECSTCAQNCAGNRDAYIDGFVYDWDSPCEQDYFGAGRAEYEEELWSIDFFKKGF